jgi:hypothetical protein
MSKKHNKIKIPIYGRELRIVIADNVQTGLKKLGLDEFEGDEVEACVVEDEDGVINLVIQPDAGVNTIAHEAFHIANGVLDDVGMKLCENSEEGYAYLIGWVAEQIEKTIKQIKTTKK